MKAQSLIDKFFLFVLQNISLADQLPALPGIVAQYLCLHPGTFSPWSLLIFQLKFKAAHPLTTEILNLCRIPFQILGNFIQPLLEQFLFENIVHQPGPVTVVRSFLTGPGLNHQSFQAYTLDERLLCGGLGGSLHRAGRISGYCRLGTGDTLS